MLVWRKRYSNLVARRGTKVYRIYPVVFGGVGLSVSKKRELLYADTFPTYEDAKVEAEKH